MVDGEDTKCTVTREAANDTDFDGVNKDNCVHDVMVMGNLEVAEDPSYDIDNGCVNDVDQIILLIIYLGIHSMIENNKLYV